MAATHIVSIFLPNTLKFHDGPPDSKAPSPPLAPTPPSMVQSGKRSSMRLVLPSRPSATSLFTGTTPPLTPSIANERFFIPTTTDTTTRHFAKLGDPRSLVHSDAEVPEWGAEPVFNQPRSRAAPLPSGSILDFGRIHEELEEQTERTAVVAAAAPAAKKPRSPPPTNSRPSRNPSAERGSYASKTWTVEPPMQGNGGLTNAMRAAAGASADGDLEVCWIGTLGFPTDVLPSSMREEIDDQLVNEYQSEVVYVSDKDLHGHYSGYCKTILWPIFHYQVPDHPKSKAYADHSWQYYENVNQAFADKVVDCYKRGDTIWVHDYHLLLVPAMVRKKLPDAQIGFFLHTAFPSSEVFRCLATRKTLLEGVLGSNLVAFQTHEYAQHFLQTCSRLLTVETTDEGVQLEDRFVNITSQPLGINPPAIVEARQTDDVLEWVQTIQERYKDKKLIVARDKLDNVHGVRQKLLAYELFLNKYPEWKEKTVLIQVATSTSEQSELLITVSDICSRIDNVHASLVHQPLVFLKQDIDFSQYLALLTAADCLMISALRDGMNLTAHEYVACQDGMINDKKHGPVILSEFTGSAAVLQGHITINPWDYHQMAVAIKQALEMNDAEKEQRWQSMNAIVQRQTGIHWAEQLSKTLTKVYEEQNQRASTSIPRLPVARLSDKYKESGHRLFFIDYEGTLVPPKTNIGVSLAQTQRIASILNDLLSDPKNTVYIMSGQSPEELSLTFHGTRGLGLIAENGCFIRMAGARSGVWESPVPPNATKSWRKDVLAILKHFQERMEGSYFEERRCSLTFRYDKVEDQEAALRQAGDCAEQINSSCKSLRVQAVPITKAVLIESTEFSKATASARIFESACRYLEAKGQSAPDFLMVAGDDRDDEAVFRWANELGKQSTVPNVFTVSVGKRNTEAQAALNQGSTGLLTVLQKLARISTDELPDDYSTTRGR